MYILMSNLRKSYVLTHVGECECRRHSPGRGTTLHDVKGVSLKVAPSTHTRTHFHKAMTLFPQQDSRAATGTTLLKIRVIKVSSWRAKVPPREMRKTFHGKGFTSTSVVTWPLGGVPVVSGIRVLAVDSLSSVCCVGNLKAWSTPWAN